MEKNVKCDLYLTLKKSSIDETKKAVNDDAISEFGKEEGADELYYPNLTWDTDEVYFDKEDNSIHISGEFFFNGKALGYLSPMIPLGNDTILEIIEYRMKKLGKLKTVMEALKD